MLLASGAVKKSVALVIFFVLLIGGFLMAWWIRDKFLFVLGLYFLLNMGYSFGLKAIPVLDILILSAGFIFRIKAGSIITYTALSEWIMIMVFLLALFMAIGKRRDDVLLKLSSGTEMRKAVKGYNLEFLNVLLGLVCGVIIVAYLMYTMSEETIERLGSRRLVRCVTQSLPPAGRCVFCSLPTEYHEN